MHCLVPRPFIKRFSYKRWWYKARAVVFAWLVSWCSFIPQNIKTIACSKSARTDWWFYYGSLYWRGRDTLGSRDAIVPALGSFNGDLDKRLSKYICWYTHQTQCHHTAKLLCCKCLSVRVRVDTCIHCHLSSKVIMIQYRCIHKWWCKCISSIKQDHLSSSRRVRDGLAWQTTWVYALLTDCHYC